MIDPKLDGMAQIALNRYRVSAVAVGAEHFTVFARDPKHAMALIQKGQGRPAGVTPAKVVKFEVSLMGGDEPTILNPQQAAEAAGEAPQDEKEGLIKVVK